MQHIIRVVLYGRAEGHVLVVVRPQCPCALEKAVERAVNCGDKDHGAVRVDVHQAQVLGCEGPGAVVHTTVEEDVRHPHCPEVAPVGRRRKHTGKGLGVCIEVVHFDCFVGVFSVVFE